MNQVLCIPDFLTEPVLHRIDLLLVVPDIFLGLLPEPVVRGLDSGLFVDQCIPDVDRFWPVDGLVVDMDDFDAVDRDLEESRALPLGWYSIVLDLSIGGYT